MTDRRDHGTTIVELVITLSVLGILMTSLVFAVRTVGMSGAPVQARLAATQSTVIQQLQQTSPSTTTPDVTNDEPVAVSFPTPHRCRGGITIVIDTSVSIYNQGTAPTLVSSVRSVLHALTGAPVRVRLVTFDLLASTLSPASTTGVHTSMLTASAAREALHTAVESLDDSATNWRAGSNWEDGLWQAVRRDVGSLLPTQTDLIVFITDGEPTRNRLNTSSDGDNTFHSTDLSRAVTAATYARSVGATLAGVIVGTGATPTAIDYLRTVIGDDVTSGTFAALASLLVAIVRSQCGNTLTLIPRLDTAGVLGPASGTWTVTVNGATHTIDATSALTIESSGATAVIATIDAPGFIWQRIDCSTNNQSSPSITVLPESIALSPDVSTSCQLVATTP